MHDWRTAFLHQAASDYRVFKRLHGSEAVEACHAAHYLQMMSEKAAKSMLTDGRTPPRPDHSALSRCLRSLKRDPAVQRRSRLDMDRLDHVISGLMAFAKRIESYAPTRDGQQPNPEYPWQPTAEGGVVVPIEHRFSELQPENLPQLKKFLWLFQAYFEANGVAVEDVPNAS